MDKDNEVRETAEPSHRERDSAPGVPPKPRGNPEATREWVEQGEEQLEKVSGN